MDSAVALAEYLAVNGEAGFGSCSGKATHEIRPPLIALLRRLCLISQAPRKLRKAASHCGGVAPTSKLLPFHDTPFLADAGNKVYAVVVDKRIAQVQCEDKEEISKYEIDFLLR